MAVKVNAPHVLAKELARFKERAVIVIGGGVGDSYQPVERQYQLTRQVLELILRFNLPCLILTKSELVLRDLNMLREIPGVGPVIERLVVEMVETGACECYHQLAPWS